MIKKEREIDKDTVVAYHARVQNQIKNELNGLNLGPGRFPMFLAAMFYLGGLILGVIGVLVITLRHRHVYLISWNDQFLGPAFIVFFLLCVGMGTYMVLVALRRTNKYRRGLVVSLHKQKSFKYLSNIAHTCSRIVQCPFLSGLKRSFSGTVCVKLLKILLLLIKISFL